ncbi:condensin subunit SMC4 [Lachancea thermotolerans CBS 6340]|uniref:Structural maintenance of chromosomes protein n=1 Tax=Lachancea thermotolerans (strain ATCC 56472 / CBS 6340 / NRRL Y-8284) TaxID=559295 RepID=C5DN32_LACTC|nr:KLTH0G13750p [Lachancea thermotolerans CBS 6340]CAR25193.1 KLTH0G13750p [Lachancea thermotolerans CBS 6340]
MESPLSKKQKTFVNRDEDFSQTEESVDVTRASRSRTPRKLVLGSPDKRFAFSQPVTSSSSNVPYLQPLKSELSSSRGRVYSQSPPRSPTRSPTRKLELIQLSPTKKTRLESQKTEQVRGLAQPIERLCINRLSLHNFKSYAGTQVVGPFHSSFSAVVGPNGSGKSNVIDSLLFVFGFRANKMRQGKLSDLIHKSEAHPNLDSCHVEVFFQYVQDELDGRTTVRQDRPGLVVTRKAFKNNTSKYYVNGKESSYTQVTELLRKEGIDLDHKRFLILQGEVESIAQMKPKAEKEGDDGLLEYLEDIIGTAKYKPLIEQTLVQIDQLNDVCQEKENRYEIVEREKSSLESGKDEALEFLEKEKKLTFLRSKLLQHKLWKNSFKSTNTQEKIKTLEEKLSAERAKYTEHKREIKQLESESKSLNVTIRGIKDSESSLTSEKRTCDRDRVSLEEKLKNISQKKVKAEKTHHATVNSINATQAKLEELFKDQVQYEKELDELNKSLLVEKTKLDEIKISLKGKTGAISVQIGEIEQELEPWNVKLQEKRSQIKLEETKISVLKESLAKIAEEISKSENDISNNRKKVAEQHQAIEGLEKEHTDIQRQIIIGQTECDNASNKMKEMKAVLTTHRQRSLDAKSSLSTFENKNKVLSALQRLQRSGRISGFHGRLGDLGTIDDKYDVAISTACPRLDDVVVETVECGQQCIEHLRKNKLGYARFILLDKLRSFNMNTIQTPNNVSRLFDLVHPIDNKFRNAFYSVLRDTLVAKDLKEANRVAYGKQRFRVVTLDGKLIDLSGTMSGGGNHRASGMMKSERLNTGASFTAEEVRQIDEELTERERNFKIATDTLHEMEDALQSLKDREPEIETDISKRRMEIDSLLSEIKLCEDRAASLKKEQKLNESSDDTLIEANSRLDSLKAECKLLEGEMKSKKNKIKELQEQIMKIGGTKLQLQGSLVDSIGQRISITLGKQKRDKTAVKKAENDLKRYEKQAGQLSVDIDQCTNELESIKELISSSDNKILELEASIDKLQKEGEEIEEKVREIERLIEEKSSEGQDFAVFEVDINNQLEKLNDLLNHIGKDGHDLLKQLESLKIRDVTATLQTLNKLLLSESRSGDELHGQSSEARSQEPSNGDLMEVDTVEGCMGNEPTASQPEDQMDVDEPEEMETSPSDLPKLTEAQLKELNVEEVELEIGQLNDFVENAYADIEVLEEYTKRLVDFQARKLELNKAVEQRDSVRQNCDNLRKKRLDEFMNGFNTISMTLKEMYQMITMGGNAELELVDSLDPFSEGVLFSVMPPKKSWRNISNLSGGEKTLSSLALVFALHKYKPTPLYVMDEIDAALDFRNVSIVANYIKERTKNAQFIVISLRNNMFELAQQLVGIYKNRNMTKSVALENKDLINRS